MNVFYTRYESVQIYSTARKAVEACVGQDWNVVCVSDNDPSTHYEYQLNADTVSKAIKQLNKQGYLSLCGGAEGMEIGKTEVL